MNRRRLPVVVSVAVFAGMLGCATSEIPTTEIEPRFTRVDGTGPYTWTSEGGWLETSEGTWGDTEHVRIEARRAFDAGAADVRAFADALAGFLLLEERGASAQVKDLSFYIAECYYHLGHYEEALEYYRHVYRRDFPSPDLIDRARRRVFEIGISYLKERKTRSLLGISYTSPDYGIDVLADPVDGLITENPHLSFADDGLIAIADYYFDDEQYPEAVPLYDRVVEMRSEEWGDHAEYKAALAEYLQIRGVDYDQAKMQEAERRFKQYLQHHPRGGQWEEARAKVREIAEMEAEKNLRIAKFYLRESQPRSTEVYLRLVLDRNPNSSAAREAREIRRELDRTRDRW